MIDKVTPHLSQNESPIFERSSPGELNKALLKKKIIGGLPLGRFYPELSDSVLLCATEMTERSGMDLLAEVSQ